MRYVVVPEPIKLVNLNGKPYMDAPEKEGGTSAEAAPISMHRWLMMYIVGELEIIAPAFQGANPTVKPKMGVGYEGNRSIGHIDRAFEKAQPGDEVVVDEGDWEKVVKIVKERVWPVTTIGAQFLAFDEAWVEAKKEPRKVS